MNLQHLRTFVVTARVGNLTRAAERLFLSQPAASAHLKALEEAFGVRLFTRLPAGLRLTAAGQRLAERAEQLLLDADAMLAQARQFSATLTGLLRLGTASDPEPLRIGTLLAHLRQACPLVEVTVEQRSSIGCLEAVRAGELDACVCLRLRPADGVAAVKLGELPFVTAAAPGWREALRPWTPAASAAQPWPLGR
jgi:DNA-binding transcriptional LysR family regulator